VATGKKAQDAPDHPVTDQQDGAPKTEAQEEEASKPSWNPATHGPLDDDKAGNYTIVERPGEPPEYSPVTGQPVEGKSE
jgi:hypothetical protein